jgi:hypothetical protein
MGVKHLLVNWQSFAGKAFKSWRPTSRTTDRRPYDHVLFDVNNLLYVKSVDSRSELIGHCFRQIDNVLRSVDVSKSLMLAFDGCAPLGKLVRTYIDSRHIP